MALSQALRRVTLQISRNFGSELPSQISSLNAFLPLQTPRIIVKNVAINAEPSSKRLIHTQIARNARRKVVGRSMPVISVRSLSIKSPLLVDQSSPGMLSLSLFESVHLCLLNAVLIPFMWLQPLCPFRGVSGIISLEDLRCWAQSPFSTWK